MRRCALLLLLLLPLLLSACSGSYASTLEANWGLALPEGYDEIYATDSGASFHGDGIRYHVFSYEEGAARPDAAWGEAAGPTHFADGVVSAAEDFLAQLSDIPSEWRIPYEACVSAYDSQEDLSELLLFLDEESRTLYVVESFL